MKRRGSVRCGRSFLHVKHFWLIAVPEKGVNNVCYHRIALSACCGPFLYLLCSLAGGSSSWFHGSCHFMVFVVGGHSRRYISALILIMVYRIWRVFKILVTQWQVALLLNALSFGRIVMILAAQPAGFWEGPMLVEWTEDISWKKMWPKFRFSWCGFAQFPVRVIRELAARLSIWRFKW